MSTGYFVALGLVEAIACLTAALVEAAGFDPHCFESWLSLLRRRPVTGGDVFDLQIVAAMQANAVERINTFNTSDFEAFSEISVVTPQKAIRCHQDGKRVRDIGRIFNAHYATIYGWCSSPK